MMHWDGHGGGGVIGMVIFMVLLWGSIVALFWVGLRGLLDGVKHPDVRRRQEPRDILAERLARGEIEPDEFRRRLEMLDGER